MRLGSEATTYRAATCARARSRRGRCDFCRRAGRASRVSGRHGESGRDSRRRAGRERTFPSSATADVITPQAAKKCWMKPAAPELSIGRGAFYDPWTFQHTLDYLGRAGSPLPAAGANAVDGAHGVTRLPQPTAPHPPEPTFAERVRGCAGHLDSMIEVFGEEPGCRMFRKVAPWYAKRFGPCRRIRQTRRAGFHPGRFHEVLENYTRWRAPAASRQQRRIALASFRPPPLRSRRSCARNRRQPNAKQIPVHRRPVQVVQLSHRGCRTGLCSLFGKAY